MKKALSFAVALGLVAGMAYTASAADNLSVSGDARWRGYYKNNNTDTWDNAQDRTQQMDQRYRLNAKVTVNDDVSVSTRLVLADDVFGGPGTNAGLSHMVDRAHMNINAFGGTWIIGRQDASWGNKFLGWGNGVDRIKGVYKAGDLTYGGYLQKSAEGALANGDGDTDVYAAFLIGKAGDTKYGVLLNYIYKDSKYTVNNPTNINAGTPAPAFWVTEPGDGQSITGHLVDVFLNAKAGPASIMAELVYAGGDAGGNKHFDLTPAGPNDAKRDPQGYYGGFIGASMAAGPANVKGIFAMYDGNMGSVGGRDCDNDFAPSLLIGKCNETAIIDFGQTTGTDSDSTWLVAAGFDMKASDKVTVGAGIGYLMASEEGGLVPAGATTGSDDATLTEVDVFMKYALAQNATYSLGIAMGMPDNMNVETINGVDTVVDDDIFVIGNRIDVKF